jgi:hypothetical protein
MMLDGRWQVMDHAQCQNPPAGAPFLFVLPMNACFAKFQSISKRVIAGGDDGDESRAD